MRRRLPWVLALLLPQVPLHPMLGPGPGTLLHPLGRDELGREALLRLLRAAAESLGFGSAVAAAALAFASLLALHRASEPLTSALRLLPPALVLLPLAAASGGLDPLRLGLALALLLALQAAPALAARREALARSPAWAQTTVLGAGLRHRARFALAWMRPALDGLFPTLWLGAVWGEALLSVLGLGPGPERDTLGRLLREELGRLATDPTPLGWAALAAVLGLAWTSMPRTETR